MIVSSNLDMANPQYWTGSKCELRDHKSKFGFSNRAILIAGHHFTKKRVKIVY